MHGVFLDLDTISYQGDSDLTPLRRVLTELRTFGTTPTQQLTERVADGEVVLTNKVKLNAPALARFTRVLIAKVNCRVTKISKDEPRYVHAGFFQAG